MAKQMTSKQIFRNRIGIGAINFVCAALSLWLFAAMGKTEFGVAVAVFAIPVAFLIAGALAIWVAFSGRRMDMIFRQ